MTTGISFNPIYLPTNQGHGNARRASLDACKHSLVALMDADDISFPHRFEKQLSMFAADSQLDIVGGQILEFVETPTEPIARRVVPESDEEIKKYMKRRCPMNQVSVMFKKASYVQVGGYIDWYCEEDYYLWVRMIQAGCKFANAPDDLVYVRVGDEMSARRGGMQYFKSEEKLQRYMLKNKLLSFPRYLYNTTVRFGGEVIIPTGLRTKLFRMLRSKPENKLEATGNSDPSGCACYPPFSVAMCVYGKDNAAWFDEALNSIVTQTVKPAEIVLVVDGPIPAEIQAIIGKYAEICGGGGKI